MKDTITKIQPSDLISDSMVKINRNFEIISNRDDVTESKLNQWAERIENQLADIRNDNGIISNTLLNNVQKLENKINNITNLDGIAKEVQNIVNNASTDVEKLINDKAGEAISSRLGDYVKTSTLNKTLGGYISSTAFDTYKSDSSKSSAQSSRIVANSKFLKLPNGDIDCLVRISGEITEFKSVEDYFKSLSASEKATILGDKTFSSDDKALEDPDVVAKLIEVCERTFKTIVSEMSVISQEVGPGNVENTIIATVKNGKTGKDITASIFTKANKDGGSVIALNADHINIDGDHALTVKSGGNINIESGGDFIISSGGKFQVKSGNFNIDEKGNVSVKGEIEAKSLKITGSDGSMVDISDEAKLANFVKGHQDDKWLKDALNNGTTTIDGGLVLSNAILTKDIANNITAGMIGSNNTESDIRFFAGSNMSDINNAPFKVYANGHLEATNATISGEITANEFSAEKSQNINYDNKTYVVTKSTTITGDTFEIGLSTVPDVLNKFSGNKVYIKLVNELQDESGTISKDKTLHCVPVLCMKYCGKEYMLSPASWISSPLLAEMWWGEIGNAKEYSRINPNGVNYFFETTYGNCYMYDNASGILESENVNLCQLNYSVSDEAYKNEVEKKLLGTIPPLIDSNSKEGKYALNVTANLHAIVDDSNCKVFAENLVNLKYYGISSELKTKSNSDTDLNKYGLQKARDFIKKILKETGNPLSSNYGSVYGWYNGPIGSGSSSSVTFDANDVYRLIPFLTVTENNNYGGLETGNSTIKVDIQYTPIKELQYGDLVNTVRNIDFTIIYTINCKYESTGSNNQITINGNKYNVSEGKFILKCNCILNMNTPYEDTYDKPTDTDNVWKTYLPDCFDKINFNDISVNTQNVFNFTGDVQISGAADNYIHIEKKS